MVYGGAVPAHETPAKKQRLAYVTISFQMFHTKNKTELWTFEWIHGAPHNWKQIATFRDEIIAESEVEKILKKYGLLKEVSE